MPASEPNTGLKIEHDGEQSSSNSTEPMISASATSNSSAISSHMPIVISSEDVGSSTSEVSPPSSTETAEPSPTGTHTSSPSDIPPSSTTQAAESSSEFDPFAIFGQPTASSSSSSLTSTTTPTSTDTQNSQQSASASSPVFVTITHTPASTITPLAAVAANQAFAPFVKPAAAAPGPAVSYIIDPKPAIVTLQVVDGKLVPAGSAATAYALAGLGGVQGKAVALGTGTGAEVGADDIVNAALNAPNLHYVNPLMNLASEIVILTQPKDAGCNMQCLPFRTNTVKCNTDFPLLTADLKKSSTTTTNAANQKTNTSLTACICEPFIQRGSCEACFTKNSTLATMPQMSYFSGINSRCPVIGESSAASSSRGALPSITNDPDGTTTANNDPLQGVDRKLLAAVCDGTGLSKSDPKTYESCKNGLNVAAILNTTDDMLRQKIPAWKGSLSSNTVTSSSSNAANGNNKTRNAYCDTVLENNQFWFETCIRQQGNAALGSLQGTIGLSLGVAAIVVGTGLWLLA
ncbi:hypothetical protein QFC24_003175 [Naganishia onofrii]|uniref:Uncharacterized protein n=1 Tax=Naganishia onofrii TaxID=1851511 RepID=A0ACC2XME9_9TREE|nr:hypothetical protein QFC24_003175 [Naganishia onofrii]